MAVILKSNGFRIILSGCATHPEPGFANTYGQTLPIADSIIRNAFAGREGALVFVGCSSGAISNFRPNAAAERVAPCVPAFQALARQIGPERMQSWIAKLGYGDRDTSAGIDVFWLPAKGRNTILISPVEQAQLMHRLEAMAARIRRNNHCGVNLSLFESGEYEKVCNSVNLFFFTLGLCNFLHGET